MGYSISQETHERIQKLQAEGCCQMDRWSRVSDVPPRSGDQRGGDPRRNTGQVDRGEALGGAGYVTTLAQAFLELCLMGCVVRFHGDAQQERKGKR
jgi:hypothetical protein